MSSQSGARENRLAGEVSPYLLLHKTNPVDWYPWGEEALTRARDEDKPIFLSVGYSTCYWCHVMERESFSDPQVAALMNEHFVNVKLDREERPDLDEIYMAATQLLTQQGGWPNSVFLTPRLLPYFAGTYFPPENSQEMPGFSTVLKSMAEAWKSRRDDVHAQARELEGAMRRFLEERGAPAEAAPPAAVAERSLESLSSRFDAAWGGFGGAPKFPSPANLFLLDELAPERPEAARMLTATLDQMARGGLYDQLAGGFHRYATDHEWKIPHFEKMLYDNGLLLELYAREHQRTKEAEPARVARETADFLEREMSAPEGGFWSAIDAETHGHEGAYYVWTLEELEAVLGAEDAGFLATLYGFDRAPFFEGGSYVLHLPLAFEEQTQRRRMTRGSLLEQIAPLKARLLEARGGRERPATDDKVLTDWNGMAISGLAAAGRILGESWMVERAARAADFVWDHLRPGGVSPEGSKRILHHSWRGGRAKHAGFLSDYAFYAGGLLELHRATTERRWLDRAAAVTDEQIERLADRRGGFCVAGEQPDVLFRSREVFDGALPSANAVAVLNLLALADRTGEERWRRIAGATLRAFGAIVEQQPEGARMLALAARRYHAQVGEGEEARESPAPPSPLSDLESEARGLVSTRVSIEGAGPGDWRPFRLRIEIEDGWHVGAHGADSKAAVPTHLVADGADLRHVSYPTGAEQGRIWIYSGSFEITGELRAEEGSTPRLVLSYQACDETRCLPPVEIEVDLPPTSSGCS